jgi:TolB protein
MMSRASRVVGLMAAGTFLFAAPMRARDTRITSEPLQVQGTPTQPQQPSPPQQPQPTPPQQPQQQTQLTLSLSGSGSHPRLAIPAFTGEGADADLLAAAKTVADVLWDDVDFEQEFDLVSKDAAARVPVAQTVETQPYDRWQELGADALVIGSIQRAAAGFTIDLKLVGVRGGDKQQQRFGQSYKGCVFANARACAHFISDDMHQKLRGLDGVAQTRLAFTSDRDAQRLAGRSISAQGQSKEIYISDYDGGNQYRVTANQSLNLGSSWAPDGRTLAYTSWTAGYEDIYVSNIFQARPPFRPAAGDWQRQNQFSAWSPDGTKLAFASDRDGGWDIFVVNRDGTNLHNVTNSRRAGIINGTPTWSPSGTQIAFTSDRGGSNQIYIMGADGTGLDKLTADASSTDRPTWSPAPFNTIAYAAGPGPGHDIVLIDVTTRKTIVLTDSIGDNESPAFAPNGRHVAFRTSRYGKDQIAIVSITGKIQRRVTEVGNNTSPSWSRVPR